MALGAGHRHQIMAVAGRQRVRPLLRLDGRCGGGQRGGNNKRNSAHRQTFRLR
jgi:hypothetical protein